LTDAAKLAVAAALAWRSDLFDNRLKSGQCIVDNDFRGKLNELPLPGSDIQRSWLVAHNNALGSGAAPHKRYRETCIARLIATLSDRANQGQPGSIEILLRHYQHRT
jgi:hypothetical protein